MVHLLKKMNDLKFLENKGNLKSGL